MQNIFSAIDGMHIFWIAVAAGVTAVSISKIVAEYRHKAQQRDIDATLKMEMIQRGMAADEIERVLSATNHQSGK